jgi:hypothetical protein
MGVGHGTLKWLSNNLFMGSPQFITTRTETGENLNKCCQANHPEL